MSKNKDVKKYLLEHSEVKVTLLGKYLDKYLNIMALTPYVSRLKIYDLFCGEGLYENGGKGSPLVILDAIKRMEKEGRSIPMDCLFNDIKQNKVKKVEEIINSEKVGLKSIKSIDYRIDNYENLVKELQQLLPQLKNEKAFIFIDPYGYKEIRASDIKKLLSSKNAEVLLFLPTSFMYRFIENGTPQALEDFIVELTDFKGWKSKDVRSFIEQLKIEFKNFLGEEYFVDTFTIQKDPQTVFCMFFFSSHIKGFEKMLEAKWDIDKELGKGWEFNDTAPTLFESQSANLLEDKLLGYLKSGPKTNKELYEFTLDSGFLPKHAVEVLVSLQAKAIIKVTEKNGTIARKRAFYINYDNYKFDPDKVTVKLI